MFNWDDSYLMGDIFIDSEHQLLFKLAEKINREKGTLSQKELMKYLHAIFEYTTFHFEHEEKLMAEVHWENLEHHSEIHRSIIKEMRETLIENKNVMTLQVKLSQLLTRWIVEHVTKEDQKFKAELQKKRGFLQL